MSELVVPSERYAASFRLALEEFVAEGRGLTDLDTSIGRACAWVRSHPTGLEGVREYLATQRSRADATAVDGFPRQDTFWWVEGEAFIGRISVRHWLTPALVEFGGHIGYEVRPSYRARGHATRMLGAALTYAGGLGLDRALLTCNFDNTASRKVIERCGGTLEDQRGNRLRFWIRIPS